ncbi:hypothetical protein ACFL15_00320 [Patescibacteria group bacterium]
MKKKPKLVLIIAGIVALVGILIATGALKIKGSISYTGKIKKDLDTTLIMTDPAYYLMYPSGWGLERDTYTAGIYTTEEGASSISEAPAGIVTKAGGLGNYQNTQFSTIVDMWKVELQNIGENVEFLEDKDLKIGGHDAHYFEVTYSGSGKEFQARSYIIHPEGDLYLYQVLATSLKPYWKQYKSVLSKIAESFYTD